MITLDQVRMLEDRVGKVVGAIERLKAEKNSLREELARRDSRIAELQGEIDAFKRDQAKIEEGIVNALARLGSFEEALHHDLPASVSANPAPVPPKNQAKNGQAGVIPQAAGPAASAPERPVANKAGSEEESGKESGELGIF